MLLVKALGRVTDVAGSGSVRVVEVLGAPKCLELVVLKGQTGSVSEQVDARPGSGVNQWPYLAEKTGR